MTGNAVDPVELRLGGTQLSSPSPGPPSLRSGSVKTSKIVAVAQTKLTFIKPTQSGILKTENS